MQFHALLTRPWGSQDSSLRTGPHRLTLGLGVQIPGNPPLTPSLLGEGQKDRRLEKREPKVPDHTYVWFPSHSQMQIRWLSSEGSCVLCAGGGEGARSRRGSVSHREHEGDRGPPHTCPSQPAQSPQPFCPQEPGAILSCCCRPGRAPRRPVSKSSLCNLLPAVLKPSATAGPSVIFPPQLWDTRRSRLPRAGSMR